MGPASAEQATLEAFSRPDRGCKSWLYEQYWGKNRTLEEIADQLGMSVSGTSQRFSSHGIPAYRNRDAYVVWMRPPEWFHDQYWGQGKTTREIAEDQGVDRGTVENAMRAKEVGLRDPSPEGYDNHNATILPTVGYRNGYRVWNVGHRGNVSEIREHRMTAIAEWGLDAVKGKHVHHANSIKWLNVPQFKADIPELENPNLIPTDPITHASRYSD